MLISLIFAVANAYFAFNAFRAKQWVWFSISALLFAVCSYQVVTAIL